MTEPIQSLPTVAGTFVVACALLACGGDSPTAPGAGGAGGGPTTTTTGGGEPGQLAIDFDMIPYDTELSYLTDMEFLPDDSGEMLAIDLYGGLELVRVGEDEAEVLLHAQLDDVFVEYDAGLLGLAIDPLIADNGYFYLAYTLSKSRVVLRRYTLDRDDPAATLASTVDIIDIDVETSPRWHNISALGFEDQDVMWVLMGDKGIALPDAPDLDATVAQDPTNLLGAMIRIVPSRDPDAGGYMAPPDAPSYGPGADPAVFAKGVRSPWKGIYHEGRWYYGDVGLDDVEEVNVISAAGENFGWPYVEGPCADDVHDNDPDCDDFVDPWIHYGRSSSHPFVVDDDEAVPTTKRSVYVGWIYQANEVDPYAGAWNDVLVWGDAFIGFMRAAPLGGDGEGWHLGHVAFPGAWTQGPDGYVYMAALSESPSSTNPEEVSGLPSPLFRVVPAAE